MKTLEQLNELSDYERNCLVAEKLGIPVRKRLSKDGDSVYIDDLKGTGYFADYCNDPRDYMPIAIEHRISITFSDMFVCAIHYKTNSTGGNLETYICTNNMIVKQTGRAVCIAFLLMELDKQDTENSDENNT